MSVGAEPDKTVRKLLILPMVSASWWENVVVKIKETSDTNGRVKATDPVNTALLDLQQEFTQA